MDRKKSEQTQAFQMDTYYSKSANTHHERITAMEHLSRVCDLSGVFGADIGMPNSAAIAGLFHDFGKYSFAFQGVLDGTVQHVDHAFSGAVMLYLLKAQKSKVLLKKYTPVIEAIQGHHDGLRSLDELKEDLKRAYQDERFDRCPSGKTPSLCGERAFHCAWNAFRKDFPDFAFPEVENRQVSPLAPIANMLDTRIANMLDTRMLFSCLVDADYSISASDDAPTYLQENSRPPLDAAQMLQNLERHCQELRKNSTADAALNQIRNQVYEECGNAGPLPMGLFTLTAPTGVGKTLSMLHFALQHCKTHSLKRIIIALPFLTLAEQTEREYQKIFPEVVVDHSQSNLSEKNRELAARWDAPVIITTSVRLFESLFSDNPRDCRKLHNLAGSVILFDEAQSLPAELADATVRAIQALCGKYRCSMVFSTATQPDFGSVNGITWKPIEILPHNEELFQKMRRVQTYWRKELPLPVVAEELSAESNGCCIVNLRRHARNLFALLKKQRTADGLFLLTTDLCPAHRLAVVEEIKRRQKQGLPCLVVATQCIEAGVDLDFDVMYRALAPMESIIQAAGRCNRNGRLPEGGRVVVFEPQEDGRLYPGDSYGRAAGIVKNLWAGCSQPDLSNLQVVAQYYHRFFTQGQQNPRLAAALKQKDYSQTAKEYRLIKENGVRLIVPWQGEQELFNQIQKAAEDGAIRSVHLHEAAPITISCFDEEDVRACATSLTIRKGREVTETGYFILNTGFESRYDPVMGFLPNDSMHEKLMA